MAGSGAFGSLENTFAIEGFIVLYISINVCVYIYVSLYVCTPNFSYSVVQLFSTHTYILIHTMHTYLLCFCMGV